MMSRRFGMLIKASRRYKLNHNRPFCSNNKPTNHNIDSSDKANITQGPLTHYDSYRDLDKLDFMSAAKILFTTPPKQKKFGLLNSMRRQNKFNDLIQGLIFIWFNSSLSACLLLGALFLASAVYLVAQYARSEMRRMDAELELRKQAEEAKAKEIEEKKAEEKARSDPQLLEVKVRLEKLEETVKEFVVGSNKQLDKSKTHKEVNDKETLSPSPDNSRRLEPSKSADNDITGQKESNQSAVGTGSSQKDQTVKQEENPCQDGKKE